MDHNYFRKISSSKPLSHSTKVEPKRCYSKSYRRCEVPSCGNCTLSSPNKLFLRVPSTLNVRRRWLAAAGVLTTAYGYSKKPDFFFCEDHFELEKDVENYMAYKMGFIKRIRVKNGCLPSKFACQKDIPIPTVNTIIKMDVLKGKNILAIETIWDNNLKGIKSKSGLIVNVGKCTLNATSLEYDELVEEDIGYHKEYHKFNIPEGETGNLQSNQTYSHDTYSIVKLKASTEDHNYCRKY